MADLTAHVVTHILDRVRSDLTLLGSVGCIAGEDLEIILAKLPATITVSDPSAASESPISSPGTTRRPPPPTPPSRYLNATQPQMAEAKWDYNSDDPADLAFRQGDMIEILEETSPDWWKGRLNGREGLVPSNRCAKVEPAIENTSASPTASRRFLSTHGASNTFSAATGLNKIGLTAPSTDPEKKDKYSKLKSTMAHSAASGVGTGAGVAIGGRLARAIF
ncbi:LAS seventeen-binding protein 1 Short=LAS17-binding protein 1 [Rhizoctonia solani AG-1 IB]|uniref:LAS seventeen-binding protein 1 Short=LAS17-binding protein 1 n=1 Tax=Thanatephorus cucumeris (strain AG1-IB / isolate 7/3/14) TaxID=1108050 RepID=M5CD59_THACB|nr:LAS seventeen-binding protein 1 Short=LAS17-binding protein 1 [Rhizoctonia solani AG-1 IB]